MKKSILITTIVGAAVALTAFDILSECSIQNGGGAPAGYCGDPAGGNLTCKSCHSGPTPTNVSGLITSNVPIEGYTPNTTYTITATITRAGHSKFGFQVSPQSSSGTFLGTLVNTSTQTKLTGSNKYITHTSSGTSGSGSKTWTFNWTAPAAGTGDVTFYGAFLAANSNNNNSGDTVFTSTLVIPENLTTGIAKSYSNEQSISVFPNPATDLITVKADNKMIGSTFIVTDKTGRQVLTGKLNNETTTLNISELPAGVYFFEIGNQKRQTFKVVKN
jgi:hypothetical protein